MWDPAPSYIVSLFGLDFVCTLKYTSFQFNFPHFLMLATYKKLTWDSCSTLNGDFEGTGLNVYAPISHGDMTFPNVIFLVFYSISDA